MLFTAHVRNIWKDDEPDPEEPLWRYFKTERLLESLESRSLYFAAAGQFEDPFEGAVAVQPHDWPIDPRYEELEHSENAFKELRRLTKVSCWHRADYESDATWRLYASEKKGLAVVTTAGRLRAALRPFRLAPTYGEEVPWWGSVRYVNLHSERLRVSAEERFFYKHRAFEWEREFRVAITVRMAEEFGVQVPDLGVKVPYDPATLIEAVYLGPNLTAEDRGRVVDCCQTVGVGGKPVTSTLLGRPRYT